MIENKPTIMAEDLKVCRICSKAEIIFNKSLLVGIDINI